MTLSEKTHLNLISSPMQAVEAIQLAVDNLIILDFDETLFLRNSTEAYLDAIYPRPLGAVYLLAAKLIRPWRWLPAHLKADTLSKDWLLVLGATLLFPWTLLVWQFKAKQLAQAYWNQPLVEAIARNPKARIVVATLGFDCVVNPLLKHLPSAIALKVEHDAITCRFWHGAADRAKGKLKMVSAVVGETALAEAVVVTDSLTDAPLLTAAKTPCLVVWPEAKYVPAMAEFFGAIATLRAKAKKLSWIN